MSAQRASRRSGHHGVWPRGIVPCDEHKDSQHQRKTEEERGVESDDDPLLMKLRVQRQFRCRLMSGAEAHDLLHGFVHSTGGLDHMPAMVAVGMLAALLGRRALWTVPASFMVTITVGAALAMAKLQLCGHANFVRTLAREGEAEETCFHPTAGGDFAHLKVGKRCVGNVERRADDFPHELARLGPPAARTHCQFEKEVVGVNVQIETDQIRMA